MEESEYYNEYDEYEYYEEEEEKKKDDYFEFVYPNYELIQKTEMSFNGKYLLIYRTDNFLDVIELGYD